MMAKKKASPGWVVVALVVAAVSFYFKQQETVDQALSSSGSVVAEASEPNFSGSSSNTAASPSVGKLGGYEVLHGCRLVKNRRNDGDSFTVKHAKGETEFRIYFVDAPESKYKEYRNGENNGERLSQQGDYFGGLDRDETVAVGVKAKELMVDVLRGKTFTVMTKWENVYGPQRRYAFVLVNVEGRESYLHQILVEKGLGRIHTRGAALPNGVSYSRHKQHLMKLEREAKKARRGAWGM